MNKLDYKKIYRSLLQDYFSGKTGEVLSEKIRGWLPRSRYPEETDKILRDEFDRYVRQYARPDRSTLEAWGRICKQLGFIEEKPVAKRHTGFIVRSLGRRGARVAAVLLPLLVITGVYLMVNRVDGGGEPQVAAVEYNAAYRAPAEGKKKVLLADGTEVFLNAGAVLEYDSLNYSGQRNVRLSGEAYFSVAADKDNPFVVDGGDIKITVLGTEFNVKTGGQDGYSEVSLFTGSLEVNAAGQSALLGPDQQLLSHRDEGIVAVRDFDRGEVGNWRRRLDLNNVSLPEAFRMVEDHFGVPVVTDGMLPLGNSIRVSFQEPTVDDAMNIIQMITRGFDYSFERDTILVRVR